jgi:hypothetical protein
VWFGGVRYVSYINDTASENASTTKPRALVGYVDDALRRLQISADPDRSGTCASREITDGDGISARSLSGQRRSQAEGSVVAAAEEMIMCRLGVLLRVPGWSSLAIHAAHLG